MPHPRYGTDISFDGPANYRIAVKGRIEEFYSENLGGMHVTIQSHGDESKVTILTGEVKDQAELMGILSSIYELHLPILSVEYLTEDNGEARPDPDNPS